MRLEKCEQNFSGAGGTPRVTTDNTFRGNVGDPGDDLIENITRTGLTGADYTYSYDANKNKLKETINAPLANYGFGTTVGQEATYDGEDRLTNWHRDDTLRDLNWVITKVGDFSSYSVEGVAETRTHPSAHELTSITGGPNAGALSYDAKGNLTTRSDNFTFVWDFDNQLKEVTVPVGSALGNVGTHKYSYDALGRRVLKHVAGEKRLIFVHDGDQIIAEYKYTNGVVQAPGPGVLDASASNSTSSQTQSNAAVIIGTRRGTATIQRKYMYTTYIDERCLMVDRTALGASPAGTEELFYYHSNNLYSTGAMTDAAGAVQERYAYDAYGNIIFLSAAGAPLGTQASTIGQPYTYTGRRLDEETFLNHYRARYYDAFVMQRFINRDPIEYDDGYNMYAYVGGGPLVAMDPTGEASEYLAAVDGPYWDADTSRCLIRYTIRFEPTWVDHCNILYSFGLRSDFDRHPGGKTITHHIKAITKASNCTRRYLLSDILNKPGGAAVRDIIFTRMAYREMVLTGLMEGRNNSTVTAEGLALGAALPVAGVAGRGIRLPRFLRNKMARIRNQTAAGGDRGISGSVSEADAMKLGEAFVGPNHRLMSNGQGLVSEDGLRTFRFPAPKSGRNPVTGQPYSRTGRQVNFETKPAADVSPTSNVHLDVN